MQESSGPCDADDTRPKTPCINADADGITTTSPSSDPAGSIRRFDWHYRPASISMATADTRAMRETMMRMAEWIIRFIQKYFQHRQNKQIEANEMPAFPVPARPKN